MFGIPKYEILEKYFGIVFAENKALKVEQIKKKSPVKKLPKAKK